MLIAQSVGGTIKGRTFQEELAPVVCFHGPNGAGKSSRLLAVELGLRGPRSKDRRFGPGTAHVILDSAAGTIRRELAPKHSLTLDGKGGKLAEVQADIDRAVPLAAAVFDIAAFVAMSEEKKRQALLDLAAPVSAEKYSSIYPQAKPIAGERASDWLARALEAAKTERLALQGKVRDSSRSAVAIGNAVRGRFESIEAAKEELGTAQAQLERMRRKMALADQVRTVSGQVEQLQALLAGMEVPVAGAEQPIDLAPLQTQVKRATDLEHDWRSREADVARYAEQARGLQARIAGCARRNVRGQALLAHLHAEVVAGDIEAIGNVAVELGNHLVSKGWEAIGDVRQQWAIANEKEMLAQGDLQVATKAKDECSYLPATQRLASAHAHNRDVEQARARADAATRQRLTVVSQLQAAQAQLQRAQDDLGDEAIPTSADIAATQAQLGELQLEVEQMAQRQGVRQAEVKLAEESNKAAARVVELKEVEEALQDARDQVLRQSLAPVQDAMGPFCLLMDGAFEVGEDSVLGIRRGKSWLPVECLSDSEQALFGAGLALALASTGGGRLVLLDRLDVCDMDRQRNVLELATHLVQAGKLDQVLTTAHTVGEPVAGVRYVAVVGTV